VDAASLFQVLNRPGGLLALRAPTFRWRTRRRSGCPVGITRIMLAGWVDFPSSQTGPIKPLA
jgi:hypothetical protein